MADKEKVPKSVLEIMDAVFSEGNIKKQTEDYKIFAETQYSHFIALQKAGFNEVQALNIVSANLFPNIPDFLTKRGDE